MMGELLKNHEEYVGTPIVLIHRGFSQYMRYSLKQAEHFNPFASIYLIGDRANNRFSGIHHWDATKVIQDLPFNSRIYRHLSTNGFDFEFFCFQRWFLLREMMERENIHDVFYMDSDVMLYRSIASIAEELPDHQMGCLIAKDQDNYRWAASAHMSFWCREALEEFCIFILKTYTDNSGISRLVRKYEFQQRHGLPGGICDMTLLYLFSLEHDVLNLATVRNGSVFDLAIGTAENFDTDEYYLENSIKKFSWNDGIPYALSRITGQQVRFNALHFQGNAKPLMRQYLTPKISFLQSQIIEMEQLRVFKGIARRLGVSRLFRV